MVDGDGRILPFHVADVGDGQVLRGLAAYSLEVLHLFIVPATAAFEELQLDVFRKALAQRIIAMLEEEAVSPPLVRDLMRYP